MKRRRMLLIMNLSRDCEDCDRHPLLKTLFGNHVVHLEPKRVEIGFRPSDQKEEPPR